MEVCDTQVLSRNFWRTFFVEANWPWPCFYTVITNKDLLGTNNIEFFVLLKLVIINFLNFILTLFFLVNVIKRQ